MPFIFGSRARIEFTDWIIAACRAGATAAYVMGALYPVLLICTIAGVETRVGLPGVTVWGVVSAVVALAIFSGAALGEFGIVDTLLPHANTHPVYWWCGMLLALYGTAELTSWHMELTVGLAVPLVLLLLGVYVSRRRLHVQPLNGRDLALAAYWPTRSMRSFASAIVVWLVVSAAVSIVQGFNPSVAAAVALTFSAYLAVSVALAWGGNHIARIAATRIKDALEKRWEREYGDG